MMTQNISKASVKPLSRNGVGASTVFLPAHSTATRVFDFLCLQFPHISALTWQQRFDQGLIQSHLGETLQLSSAYAAFANQHLYYFRELAHEVTVPFAHAILYEDEHLLVADKPHFLTVSPTGQYVQQTLLVRLKQQTGLDHLTPIHRLDRETAGVVLFCKSPEHRGAYQQLFATQQVHKQYHAIAAYDSCMRWPQALNLYLEKSEPFYTMQVNTQRPANSHTVIRLIEHKHKLAKYLLQPSTGKQHQLRVHMAYLNLPILNDPFYPTLCHKANNDFSNPLQLLAKSIEFTDPISQQQKQFESQFNLHL